MKTVSLRRFLEVVEHKWVGAALVAMDICDAISQGILFVDAERVPVYCNRYLAAMLGMTAEEVLQRGIDTCFPECRKVISAGLQREDTGSVASITFKGRNLLVRTDPVWEGKVRKGVVVTVQDEPAVERGMKSLDLDCDVNWLDAIIDGSYDGLWICDRNGTVIRVNKATERINQIQAKDVIGKNIKDLVAEGLFDQSVTVEVLKTRAPVTMMQQIRGGKKVLVTGNPIFNDQGEIVYVLTNDRDLTEMDQLRHELQETQALAQEYISRLTEIELKGVDPSSVVCRSERMQGVLQSVQRVARLGTTILLLGESGSGKGLVAKLIHKLSRWSNGPFIRVDCVGIPETLIESELFGYERGAFTGAKAEGKVGLFELADNGTLFLDEIGEIPLSVQSKLLRFLEDHEIMRVGGVKPKSLQTRIVAATNRNIQEMVEMKLFRQDLFYRIHVVPITIPPLRERQDDILPLAFHFLKKFNQAYDEKKILSQEVIDALLKYDFPGNVRELMNFMERMVVSTKEDRIEHRHLPDQFAAVCHETIPLAAMPANVSLKEALNSYEKLLFQKAATNYRSQQELAEALGVDRATVSRKLRRYGIRLQHAGLQ